MILMSEHKRLTTEDPQNNMQVCHNLTKVIDRIVYLRDCSKERKDISLIDYCRDKCFETCGIECDPDPADFGEIMATCCDCMVSLFYWMAVGHAELRLNLSAYEDTGLSPEEIKVVVEKQVPTDE
jgi:hypothetical protein